MYHGRIIISILYSPINMHLQYSLKVYLLVTSLEIKEAN